MAKCMHCGGFKFDVFIIPTATKVDCEVNTFNNTIILNAEMSFNYDTIEDIRCDNCGKPLRKDQWYTVICGKYTAFNNIMGKK